MNFFDHKDLGNHLLQLWSKVMKHPVYTICFVLQGVSMLIHFNIKCLFAVEHAIKFFL